MSHCMPIPILITDYEIFYENDSNTNRIQSDDFENELMKRCRVSKLGDDVRVQANITFGAVTTKANVDFVEEQIQNILRQINEVIGGSGAVENGTAVAERAAPDKQLSIWIKDIDSTTTSSQHEIWKSPFVGFDDSNIHVSD